MGKHHVVNAVVIMSELTDGAKIVLRQSLLNRSFSPKDGKITVDIWEGRDDPSDDVLMVRVVSKISWRERILRYGTNDLLQESDISHMGQYGLPIPTEEWLNNMEIMYDDFVAQMAYQLFFVTHEAAEAYVQGKMTGAQVINQFAEKVQRFCDEAQYEIA